jgi:hypothetical protein
LFALFFPSDLDLKNYKNSLINDSKQILQNGISENEQGKVLEIILKLQTDFVPENYSTKTNQKPSIIGPVFILLTLIILVTFRPKSIIGLGRNKFLVSAIKLWIKLVTYVIPVYIIFQIAMNKLTSFIF